MKTTVFLIALSFIGIVSVTASSKESANEVDAKKEYPKSFASYGDFSNLVSEVEKHRADRLIGLKEFLKMSEEENTIILDTRSAFRYDRKHLEGAVHLSFTDFTQSALLDLIPDQNTKILIYCNNNFNGDQVDFASKIAAPKKRRNVETQILSNRKPVMLALNIPTYINLYGYGYRNVYELDELVEVNDARIAFEGTEVNK